MKAVAYLDQSQMKLNRAQLQEKSTNQYHRGLTTHHFDEKTTDDVWMHPTQPLLCLDSVSTT